MVTKQFLGFKSKEQLRKHISREFPSCKIESIGKRKKLPGVTKQTAPTTSYIVRLKKCR